MVMCHQCYNPKLFMTYGLDFTHHIHRFERIILKVIWVIWKMMTVFRCNQVYPIKNAECDNAVSKCKIWFVGQAPDEEVVQSQESDFDEKYNDSGQNEPTSFATEK